MNSPALFVWIVVQKADDLVGQPRVFDDFSEDFLPGITGPDDQDVGLFFSLFLELFPGQEEIDVQTAMKSSNIVMVDAAVINEDPIRPNLQLNMAISFVLALFIAIFIIFLIEFMDDTIKEEKDIEKAIGVNVIGIIPDINDIEEHK